MLATLYESELSHWKQALESSKERPQDKQESIRARAQELKQHREAERQDFVKAMYAKKFQDSCDDSRQLYSQRTLNTVADRRKEQLIEKDRQQKQEIEDDQQWSNAWEVDRLRKEQREREDLARQHKRNEDMRNDLDMQIYQRKSMERLQSETKAKEDAETMDRWNLEKQLQDEHDAKARAAMKAEGKRVLEYNNQRQTIRTHKAKEEMQNDLVLLQVALEKERQELEDEEEKKRQEKETTKLYQEHLKRQMIKEKADDTLYEELRRQDEMNAIAKRDAQKAREDLARTQLKEAVYSGRQQQIQLQLEKKQREIEADRIYAEGLKAEAARLEKLDKTMKEHQLSQRRQNRDKVVLQVSGKRQVKANEEQRKYLELKTQQYTERKYQSQLATVIGD